MVIRTSMTFSILARQSHIQKNMSLKKAREAAPKTKDGKVDLRTKEGKEVARLREERNEKRAARKAAKK